VNAPAPSRAAEIAARRGAGVFPHPRETQLMRRLRRQEAEMKRSIVSVSIAVFMMTGACGVSTVMKQQTMMKARDYHAGPNCDADTVKSQVVREISDRPSGVDYLAIVRVKGCGTERDYLCGNYLCNEGNYCNEYKCEPAK
jgi:hypothetical protein